MLLITSPEERNVATLLTPLDATNSPWLEHSTPRVRFSPFVTPQSTNAPGGSFDFEIPEKNPGKSSIT
jgi:hypothetical protein